MEPKASSHGDKNEPIVTGPHVRDTLTKYLADTLRDLPDEQRTFLRLPRTLVATEWSQWTPEMDPVLNSHSPEFNFAYVFSPFGEWDHKRISDRILQLWTIWGWECHTDSWHTGHNITGKSPDGYTLTAQLNPERGSSSILSVSPQFKHAPDEQTTMPFAVTPFGPLSMPAIWALHPDLIQW